jgi:hypothetical protein
MMSLNLFAPTVGGSNGACMEYVWLKRFALGRALSYKIRSEGRNRIGTDNLSAGLYLGISFWSAPKVCGRNGRSESERIECNSGFLKTYPPSAAMWTASSG